MILSDYPIQSAAKDLLRRAPLAQKIASLISDFESNESFVMGIEGEWGSGKTSFINLVLEKLKDEKNILTFRFNPWNFSDQNELVKDFFNSLVTALKISKALSDERGLTKLNHYGDRLIKKAAFSFEPEFTLFPRILNIKLGKSRKSDERSTLEQERKEIDSILKSINKKVLVVIDDIDRLDKTETCLIFKLVKMTANFPNTIFLLAYDGEKIANRLDEKGLPGRDYLKKIVQISFLLPQPDKQDLIRILTNDLDETIKDINEKYFDKNRWAKLFHSGFKNLFNNIRDIKRFINSLRLDYSIIGKEEVNPIDFIGVEAIRVFAPRLYQVIGNNKSTFMAGISMTSAESKKAHKENYEKILNDHSPNGVKELFKELINELFPQTESLYSNAAYGNNSQTEWRKNLRICDDSTFDKYFQFTVPVGMVSEARLIELMRTIDAPNALAEELEKFSKKGTSKYILNRMPDYVSTLTHEQKEVLLLGLFQYEDTAEDKRTGLFEETIDILISRISYNTIKSIEKEKRVDFFQGVLDKNKNVFMATYIVSLLGQSVKEFNEKKSIEEPLFSEEQIKLFSDKCVEQIKQTAAAGTLQNTRNLGSILFRWKDWGDERDIKNFIENLMKTPIGLANFLLGFTNEIFSQGMGEYTPRRYEKIDMKSLEKFYSIDEIKKKLNQFNKEGIEKLSETQKEAISLFENPPPNRF